MNTVEIDSLREIDIDESSSQKDTIKKDSSYSSGFNKDNLFNIALTAIASLVVLLVGAILISLAIYSIPVFKSEGIGFLFHDVWNPIADKFGASNAIFSWYITDFFFSITF